MLTEGSFLDKKTLLIVGAGTEQIPAYQKARERGFTVIASDMNESAPAVQYADGFIHASTRDPMETSLRAEEFHKKHKIDGVMTIANDVPLTVAKVAERLGLKSISVKAAEAASDKILMKTLFQKNKVACPWFSSVDSVEEFKKIVFSKQSDFVIKPIDGRGARGVLLVNQQSDLDWAFQESRRWGDSGKLMIEEFIPGLQLSTESFMMGGRCYTAAMAERNYSRLNQFRPYIIEDGGTIPAVISEDLAAKIDRLIESGAKAMGITDGIVKGDLVINPNGEPMIIELAARLSGGWFATHQIPFATGIDLTNVAISFALGLPIQEADLKPSKNESTCIRYWFPEPGTIQEISGEENLKNMKSLLAYGLFRKVGDQQPEVKMHPDRFGYVIATGKTREESLANANQALECLKIRISR